MAPLHGVTTLDSITLPIAVVTGSILRARATALAEELQQNGIAYSRRLRDGTNGWSDCPDLVQVLGAREENIMSHQRLRTEAVTDDFLFCKCHASEQRQIAIDCTFPSMCDEGGSCASLTMSFQYDGNHTLVAGACVDLYQDALDETCITFGFSWAWKNYENALLLLDIENLRQATYGGQECSQCIVDSEAFCVHMDCSEWSPPALTKKGCQPMGGFDQGRLDRTKFIARSFSQEGQTKDKSALFPSRSDDVNIDRYEAYSSSATVAAQFDVRVAISNSLLFLFNMARHSIL
jgi:hypothetical protein